LNNEFKNPFSDYGNIVYGERFIGRKEDLRVIENRVIRPAESGNLAIIGVPRIGKSSLVWKALIEPKEKLEEGGILPIWINMGVYEQISDFFLSLAMSCINELERLNRMNSSIRESAKLLVESEQSHYEQYINIQQLFKKIREAGFRIVFILDEFDHARFLFGGSISGFQRLRELSYRPEWRVAFITTSRRSVREIETQIKCGSTFYETFTRHYLGMFKEKEIEEYFNKFSSIGVTLPHEARERIIFYCGYNPFLLDMLGYEIVELYRTENSVDVDKAFNRVKQSFFDHYNHLIDILEEDGSLHKLLQILFGPVIDVKPPDIDLLLKYGLIKPNSEGTYTAFSEHLQAFLYMLQREIDLWPILSQTEKALRDLISTEMSKYYGEDWIIKSEKAHPKLKNIFEEARKKQQKEKKLFGTSASQNLLDFTYLNDLMAIISSEWTRIFRDIFGKEKKYWADRINFLSMIRSPLAHQRTESLTEHYQKIAEGYCKEILHTLKMKKKELIKFP